MKTSSSHIFSINSILLLCILLCTACSPEGTISRSDNYEAQIYPDYKDVTIPCNIAPMNFSVKDSSATDYALLIESGSNHIWVNASSEKDFSIPFGEWKDLLQSQSQSQGQGQRTLQFTIAREINGEWVGGKPFNMTVVPDIIDDYITYRLVPPGYESWYLMGIYQHQLSTSEQSVVYENSHNDGACMNCHTPYKQQSNKTLFHVRTSNAGTYLMHDGIVERLEAKTDSTISGFVYPGWHPNGKLVAFSNNKTAQVFHTSNKNRIEVFDSESDIVIYDLEKHEVFSTPLLKDPAKWETYPTFSPDGKWLYFCSAPPVKQVALNHEQVKYSLCRIAFDAEKQQFGTEVDTIISSTRDIAGKSVSFPRISPDGNFLICTIHKFGNFSIWHKDADLYIMDLRAKENADGTGNQLKLEPLTAANSNETDSYHTWSSTGRWLVFSSRRDDGLYTRPYFTYIDKQGKAHKPFMLPQDNPRKHYAELDYSYNIPEFMTSRVSTSRSEIYAVSTQDSTQVTYRK